MVKKITAAAVAFIAAFAIGISAIGGAHAQTSTPSTTPSPAPAPQPAFPNTGGGGAALGQ